MSGWGCPHYADETCRLMRSECVPGKKGCVLHGAFTFAPPPVFETDEPEHDEAKKPDERPLKKERS